MRRTTTITIMMVFAMTAATNHAGAETNPAITKAMSSVEAAVPKAEADPTRPVYHFRPPANWMNDPNGTIYHNGYYHVFYQHNPYGDKWGHMHWGHTRSQDLVHWEHLPIALWPSLEKGEEHIFSGCARINGKGQPMAFYTSVGPDRPNEQWAAIGDAEMLVWEKHPQNPLLHLDTHGGPRFGDPWRDPYIFEEAGRSFMVLGADMGDETMIPIYEAANTDLSDWEYRGILFRLPQEDLRFFECPNFFKVDGKWILLCSPYKPLRYFVGSLDMESLTFQPEARGILDRGGDKTANFYASNTLYDERGRCVLLGWVRGFQEGRGWNGCLALPRELTIGPDGRPWQNPVSELVALRGKHTGYSNLALSDETRILGDVAGDTLEIQALFEIGDATSFGLHVRQSSDGKDKVTIGYDGQTLDVAGTVVPLALDPDDNTLELRVFIDKCVMEVFVEGGREAVTRVVYPGEKDLGVGLFSKGGGVTVRVLNVWEMKPIW